ncbi:hypothetical protein XU18_4315 [Perkinsela sp. CCAP 1560/4]|nr:hypothetical protein XU18_4315 [Perkinsela sp. CCAP 1560/4]|eukprot:KNH04456.1 hypothetical protein XU18_4315 [Perkinsela sp. CCAP 1560/4]
MNSSSINFGAISLCSLIVTCTGCLAIVTHHWSSIEIPEDHDTPLTTATGGYDLKGSYYAGLFQFCMSHPSHGHYKTCYGITMPMDYTCHGPTEDILRTSSSLYLKLTCIRVGMITGVLFAFAATIVNAIGIFKKRKGVFLWCAFALAILQSVLFTSACGLYGYTEAYWYKCGHNQCGGALQCLFSFGYSYGLALICMFLSIFSVGYLWSMRRCIPVLNKKAGEPNKQILKDTAHANDMLKASMAAQNVDYEKNHTKMGKDSVSINQKGRPSLPKELEEPHTVCINVQGRPILSKDSEKSHSVSINSKGRLSLPKKAEQSHSVSISPDGRPSLPTKAEKSHAAAPINTDYSSASSEYSSSSEEEEEEE